MDIPQDLKEIDITAWIKWISVGVGLIAAHFGYHIIW
jgi:hypothetical protein